jgi:hypothetical protein
LQKRLDVISGDERGPEFDADLLAAQPARLHPLQGRDVALERGVMGGGRQRLAQLVADVAAEVVLRRLGLTSRRVPVGQIAEGVERGLAGGQAEQFGDACEIQAAAFAQRHGQCLPGSGGRGDRDRAAVDPPFENRRRCGVAGGLVEPLQGQDQGGDRYLHLG